MTDIVERWKDELDSLGGKPMNTAEYYANDMAGIIETLRQRVKELEGYEAAWIETAKHRDRAERELAALKIDNGLTIAYMSGFRDGKKDAQKHGEPVLYQCTKCGGANYACDCDSFRYCTKPLYEGRGDA